MLAATPSTLQQQRFESVWGVDALIFQSLIVLQGRKGPQEQTVEVVGGQHRRDYHGKVVENKLRDGVNLERLLRTATDDAANLASMHAHLGLATAVESLVQLQVWMTPLFLAGADGLVTCLASVIYIYKYI